MSVSYQTCPLLPCPPISRHSTSSRSSSIRTASLDRISASSSTPSFYTSTYSNYLKPIYTYSPKYPDFKRNYKLSDRSTDSYLYGSKKSSDLSYSKNLLSGRRDYGYKSENRYSCDSFDSREKSLSRDTRPRLRASLSSSSDCFDSQRYISKYDYTRPRERSCSITRRSSGSSQNLSTFDDISIRSKIGYFNSCENSLKDSDKNGNKLKTEVLKSISNRNKSVEKNLSSSEEEDAKSSSSCSSYSPKNYVGNQVSSRKSSGSDEGYSFMHGRNRKSSPAESFKASGAYDYLKNGGRVGLRNIGNTCFMNSVLQCLSNTKPLLEYIIGDHYHNDINTSISQMKGELMKAFSSLIREIWNSNNDSQSINTSNFKSQIQRFAPRFMGYNQQDAQEFLRYLLEGLHEDVNRVKAKPRPITTDIDDSLSENQKGIESWKRYLRFDDSKIVDIFVGQLKSTLRCTHCGHSSVTFDPFWDLSLPIPSKSSQVRLQQCFDLFTKEEVLDGDEKPTCSRCKTRRKCTKNLTIHKFPRVLVIHLKRFSPTERYRGKLSCHVEFEVNDLNLSSYSSSQSSNCHFNLYGVANHSGTTHSGHYTAYCKNPYSGKWNEFNDTRVIKISEMSVVTNEAYVLFYELSKSSSSNC